jgi:MoxR-like ATPase
MRIKMGYPEIHQEKFIIMNNSGTPLDRIGAVVDGAQLEYCLTKVSQIRIQDDVLGYMVDLVDATRRWESIELGVSPRGSIAFFKACQALAAIRGRDYILPEDVKYMAPHVLNHRIIARGKNSMEQSLKLVGDVVASVKVPIENYQV